MYRHLARAFPVVVEIMPGEQVSIDMDPDQPEQDYVFFVKNFEKQGIMNARNVVKGFTGICWADELITSDMMLEAADEFDKTINEMSENRLKLAAVSSSLHTEKLAERLRSNGNSSARGGIKIQVIDEKNQNLGAELSVGDTDQMAQKMSEMPF